MICDLIETDDIDLFIKMKVTLLEIRKLRFSYNMNML